MKKKVSLTLLLALFVIAGSWAQKKHDTRYSSNDGHCHSDGCRSNGHGNGNCHGGKHKKHKHKRHGHDHPDDYGQQGGCRHHDHDYSDQSCNSRGRDRDHDDKWSNTGSRPLPSTRPVRNTRPASKPLPLHRTLNKTVYNTKAPAKAVKVSRHGTLRTHGSTAPSRRRAHPGKN